MDEVTGNGEEVVITGSGSTAQRLAPHTAEPSMPFGRNRDKIRILGDIIEPMPAEWFGDATD